jgi:hypothetical protein
MPSFAAIDSVRTFLVRDRRFLSAYVENGNAYAEVGVGLKKRKEIRWHVPHRTKQSTLTEVGQKQNRRTKTTIIMIPVMNRKLCFLAGILGIALNLFHIPSVQQLEYRDSWRNLHLPYS